MCSETLTYDGEGAVASKTDARGNKTELLYDKAGRKTQATLTPITAGDPITQALWTYNPGDQIATQTDASGVKWTYVYDIRQRKTRETDGINRATNYAYNKHDRAGALVELKDPLNKITSYQYDGQGNRTRLTDANNRVTTWTYGRNNRLTQQTWPAVSGTSASRTWAYDLNGNLATELTENGATLTYGYDVLNRKTSLNTTGPASQPTEVIATNYSLDANGNITEIAETTASGVIKTETRTYDPVGRLKTVTDRNGKTRSYSFDAADNRIEEKDHNDTVVTHTYDTRNRLASTTTPELGTTTYAYDGADRLTTSEYANLAKETRTYDLAGQFTSLKHERAGGTLHAETYEYDTNGNRTKLTQNDGTTTRITTYTYDLADRVLTEANPEERLEDTLDAVGNRTQRLIKSGTGVLQKTLSYTINARDQVTQLQEKNASNVITKTETYSFDADGNRLTKTDGSNSAQYKYDRRGRQLAVNSTVYELNDGDVRTAKVDGTRTEYVMEGLKLEAEVANGTTTATYRWGMQLIGEARGGINKTILQDRFRSPLILLDQTGSISDRVRYTAAGEIRQRVGSSPLAFGYGGYLTQSGTDELYAFARTYSPGMARFNENDPVRSFDPMLSMGPHRYVLGYGNPLSYVDPDGRVGFLSDMRQFFDDNSASYRQAGSNPGAGKAAVIANAAGSVLNEVGAAPFRALNYLSNVGADYAGRIAPITFGGVQDRAATDLEGTFHAAEGIAYAAANPLDTRERMSNRFSHALSGDNAAAFDSAQFVGALATLPVARAFGPTLGRGLATDVTSQGRAVQALVREMDSQLATGTTVVESAATPMAHGAPLVKICGTGSCFVAGTPVMTIEGLKAIETIQVGELVAARNELTQISAWQRVETVFITYDREV